MFMKATGVNKKLKVLIYGQSGTGKTHFALTFPRPAVIDCEGGTELFGGRFDFDVLRTKDIDEVIRALESIDPAQYDTVVVDPVTVLWQVAMEAGQIAAERRATKQRRNPDEATLTQRDWGIIKRKVNSLYTRLVNIPAHCVVCGRIKDINQTRGNEIVKIGERVDAEKSTEYLFDIIIKLEIDKTGKRIGIVEKDRSGKMQGKRIENPSYESLAEIITVSAGNKTQVKAQDQTAVAEKLADDFDDAQLEQDIAHAVAVVEAAKSTAKVERPADAETVRGWLREKAWGSDVKTRTEWSDEENWRCDTKRSQQVAALFGKAISWEGADEVELRKARLLTYQYIFGQAVQSSHEMSTGEASAVIKWFGGGYEPQEPALSEARFLYHAAQVEAGQQELPLDEAQA